MKNLTVIKGQLEIIKRLPSSFFGNPRYLVRIGDQEIKTGVNSMHGYAMSNFEGCIVTASVGLHYGSITLNTIERA